MKLQIWCETHKCATTAKLGDTMISATQAFTSNPDVNADGFFEFAPQIITLNMSNLIICDNAWDNEYNTNEWAAQTCRFTFKKGD